MRQPRVPIPATEGGIPPPASEEEDPRGDGLVVGERLPPSREEHGTEHGAEHGAEQADSADGSSPSYALPTTEQRMERRLRLPPKRRNAAEVVLLPSDLASYRPPREAIVD